VDTPVSYIGYILPCKESKKLTFSIVFTSKKRVDGKKTHPPQNKGVKKHPSKLSFDSIGGGVNLRMPLFCLFSA